VGQYGVDSAVGVGHDVESAHIIDDHNLKLLELATTLASDITGQYSHPFELTQADALLITLAGRQRMLTQKMAKDACEIWTGYHAEDGRADLEKSMKTFETALTALRFGMPALGVKPAPTEVIAKDLDSLLERWGVLRGNLDALLAGEELNMDQKYEIIHDFNIELDELDHLIHDYKIYAERHHG
ncbi:MAG: type IV pili methyl-accepting chemotaxis transducer N-terminal domain-containing protein, partial [Pseudomonadota bacterium]